MERAEQAMVERVINHEMRERFTAGAVRRAVLLQHGDDPAIAPGQLMVRVFVEAPDEPGLTAWQAAHQEGIDNFRRELSLRLPAARLLEFTSILLATSPVRRRSACRTTGRWRPSSCPGARS